MVSQFASAEGKQGGEFYTPRSIVKLLIDMLEPFNGRRDDPCLMCTWGVSRDSSGERQTWRGTGTTRTGVGVRSDLRSRERTRRTPICGFRTLEDATL